MQTVLQRERICLHSTYQYQLVNDLVVREAKLSPDVAFLIDGSES